MGTFTVDPASLSGLSSTLSSIHNQMQGMQGVASGYEGLLGGSDLEGEVSSFCSTWHYGISQLGQHMADVVQRLDYAAAGYGKSEQSIVNAAQTHGGQ
ncbi:MAG TPA: hypothetical protein VGL69_11380 [Solirubrobacteraceae bacterium]|jgi:hypothetical protein